MALGNGDSTWLEGHITRQFYSHRPRVRRRSCIDSGFEVRDYSMLKDIKLNIT